MDATDSNASPYRLVVSGYYGFNNLGDELILRVLAQQCQQRGYHLTALSQDPAHTAAAYGIEAVPRLSLRAISKALWHAHLFISGGGGLFQDATGLGSPVYYGGLIHWAKLLSVPVFFWSQGVGPLTHPVSQAWAGSALRASSAITVRDEASAQLAAKLRGEPNAVPIETTADPVWLLEMPQATHPQVGTDTFNIGLSLRAWPTLTPDRVDALVQVWKQWIPQQETTRHQAARVLLMPFQPSQDRGVLEAVAQGLAQAGLGDRVVWIEPEEILTTIGLCHVMVGMRFHSVILALLTGVPVYAVAYDPKVSALMTQLGLNGAAVEALDEATWQAAMASLTMSPALPDLTPLKAQAEGNFQRIDALLAAHRKGMVEPNHG
jgi:polysaccharide pyruvyl transferase CsaB